MLVYEHERTEQVVNRLRRSETVVRAVTLLISVIVFAVLGGAVLSSDFIVGVLLGAVVGIAIGNYSMVLLSAVIEWMCQSLVAQGAIVESVRR